MKSFTPLLLPLSVQRQSLQGLLSLPFSLSCLVLNVLSSTFPLIFLKLFHELRRVELDGHKVIQEGSHTETLFRREQIRPNHHGSVANLMRRVDAPRQSRVNVTHLCRNLALSPRCLPLHTPSDVRPRLHESLPHSYCHPARGLEA